MCGAHANEPTGGAGEAGGAPVVTRDVGAESLGNRIGHWFAISPAGPLLVAAGAIGGCIAVNAADPTTPGGPIPECPTKAIFGIACPCCGTARMLYSLTTFDLTGALRYNAVALVTVLALVWSWFAWFGRTLGKNLPDWMTWKWLPHTITIVLVVWFIVRLLPFAPFTALAV